MNATFTVHVHGKPTMRWYMPWNQNSVAMSFEGGGDITIFFGSDMLGALKMALALDWDEDSRVAPVENGDNLHAGDGRDWCEGKLIRLERERIEYLRAEHAKREEAAA